MVLLTSLVCIRLLSAQVTTNLTIAPTSTPGFGAGPFLRFRQANGNLIDFKFPDGTTGGITTSYSMRLPPAQAAAGGQFLFNDGTGVLSWQNVTSGGGGGVTAVTASTPLTSTGGSTPNIACPNCARLDQNNAPSGLYDWGSSGSQWSNTYSAVFQSVVGVCANGAYIGTNPGGGLFGGYAHVKDSSCVVQAKMDQNGFDTVGTIGNYKVQGTTVIDPSRNATFNNLTILGTCIGCPSGGGGSVSAVSATAPILSSGGSSPNISCPTCMRMGNSDINVPAFNVEIGTISNWIYKIYSQHHLSSTGICADAAGMVSVVGFGGTIYTKNSPSCALVAQMDYSGFDTGPLGVYKIQGVTVVNASRAATFTTMTATSASLTSLSATTVSAANFASGISTGITRVINVTCAGGAAGTITTTSGLVTSTTCP